MLIQSLAQKTRLAMLTILATLVGSVALCGFTLWRCLALVGEERQQIYILDGDIPFLAERAQLEANFSMEAKAHIQLFHHSLSRSFFVSLLWDLEICWIKVVLL